VAHTKLGFVELTRDRTAPEAVLSAKKMIRDLHIAGPDPKPLVRIHTDDDTSFKGEFKEYMLDEKVDQTDTGGHRPTNNAHAEKRIGLLVYCFRALLYTATGGGRYYDQLWGPGIVHANTMLNYSTIFSMELAPELGAEGRRKSELQAWRVGERGREGQGTQRKESRGVVGRRMARGQVMKCQMLLGWRQM